MKKMCVLFCMCLVVFLGYSTALSAVPVTSGLVLQLDASDVTTRTDGSTTYVTSWNDLVGTNDAVQTDETMQPTLVSGITPAMGSAIRFDGTNDYLAMPTTFEGANWTIFAVYAVDALDSGSGGRRIVNLGYSDIDPNATTKAGPTTYTLITGGTSAAVRGTSRTIANGFIAASTSTPMGYAANTFYIAAMTNDYPSTNITAYLYNQAGAVINSTASGSTAFGAGNTVARIGAGTASTTSTTPASFHKGLVSEILIYNRVLTSEEMTSVSNYLLTKHMPPMAYNPTPTNAGNAYDRALSLKWTPANGVTSQILYFSTDYNSVNNSAPAALKSTLTSDANSYAVSNLQMSTKYYWRVNHVVGGNTVIGSLWSFELPAYYRVDDFENYIGTSTGSAPLRTKWKDGWSMDPGTELGSFAVLVNKTAGATDANTKGELRLGKKSLLFAFDNTGSAIDYEYPGGFTDVFTPAHPYAEVSVSLASLPIGADWTTQGDWTLILYFYGLAGNSTSSPLYLLLEDASGHVGTPVVYPTSSDIAVAAWHTWEICSEDLAKNNVDLSNLSKLRIGFGDRNNPQVGGKGNVYFDDIRMHRETMLTTDLNKDCRVNFEDFAILALDWLMHAGCAN
jgi:hypothetical protein